MRRALLGLGVLALIGASCSAQDAIGFPGCEGEGPQVIVAQSVSSASQIPCLSGLPDGWSLSRADVGESGSVFTFDSDRAGAGAAILTLRGGCDVVSGISVPGSELDPGDNVVEPDVIDNYEEIISLDPSLRSLRSYVFEGGCVQWSFDFDREVSATLTVELDGRLRFLSREDFQRSLAEDFLDVEL